MTEEDLVMDIFKRQKAIQKTVNTSLTGKVDKYSIR